MNLKDAASKGASLLGLPFIDANINVYFYLDGREYEVEQFKINFIQPNDHKGEPQNETKGGQMLVVLSQALPESFYTWAIKTKDLKNGLVLFKTESSSMPVRIEFFNTTCISFTRQVNAYGGLQTSLILSPEVVKINGHEHNNFWKK